MKKKIHYLKKKKKKENVTEYSYMGSFERKQDSDPRSPGGGGVARWPVPYLP
jgi:hypothetical protein